MDNLPKWKRDVTINLGLFPCVPVKKPRLYIVPDSAQYPVRTEDSALMERLNKEMSGD